MQLSPTFVKRTSIAMAGVVAVGTLSMASLASARSPLSLGIQRCIDLYVRHRDTSFVDSNNLRLCINAAVFGGGNSSSSSSMSSSVSSPGSMSSSSRSSSLSSMSSVSSASSMSSSNSNSSMSSSMPSSMSSSSVSSGSSMSSSVSSMSSVSSSLSSASSLSSVSSSNSSMSSSMPSSMSSSSLSSASSLSSSSVSSLAGVSVNISNSSFQPGSITVKKGTAVTWTNNDNAIHTVTRDAFFGGGPLSGIISQGGSYSFTFSTPGTYAYHCAVHPEMHGTVVVTD